MTNPDISIVMPVKNAALTLPECLDSIRAQTFTDFDLIVIDDHSTDDSRNIIAAAEDLPIRNYNNPGHGLVAALTHGVHQSRAPWIARMDADDIMHPRRLECQINTVRKNPKIDCLATRVELFSDTPIGAGMHRYIEWQNTCISRAEIENAIYTEAPLTHPSTLLNRSRLLDIGGYRDGEFPEDYELWLRMVSNGYHLEKLASTRLSWRVNEQSATRTDSRYSENAFNRIRMDYLTHDARILNAKSIFIWGSGPKTRRRFRTLLEQQTNVSGWIDIDPKKIGAVYHSNFVYSPLDAMTQQPDLIVVGVNSNGAKPLIQKFLEQHIYSEGKNYLMVG